MDKKRESNYELLRLISCVAVIMIHVSGTYFNAYTGVDANCAYDFEHMYVVSFYNSISRFAVPCFVMLSGAFVLADDRNANYLYFYRKTFSNIGVPTVIFSIIYFLYYLGREGVSILVKGKGMENLWLPVISFLKGEPFYHLWYLYVMIGVYVLVPIVVRLKKDIGEKKFEKVTWFFLFFASVSAWTINPYIIKWNLGVSFCYMGYFMAGYVIRKNHVKNTIKGLGCIVLGLIVEIVMSVARYSQALAGIGDGELKYTLIEPCAPWVVMASLMIFAGFSKLNIENGINKVSQKTFLVFLIHAGVWDILSKIVLKLGKEADSRYTIPVSIVIVFLISYLLTYVYTFIWNFVDEKIKLSEKMQNCLFPQ